MIVPPPQLPVSPFGVETIRPVGNVSLKPTPVSPTVLPAGLAIVKLKVADPFSGMLAAAKASLIIGGAATATEAEAVPPVPPSTEVTPPVMLFCAPAAVPFTFAENVQEVFAPRAAPVKLTTPVPAVAVIVPPPQVPANPLGVATTKPAGSVSLKLTPVRAIAFTAVLETVKLREVLPLSGIEAAPKDLAIEGGAPTVRLAVAELPVPPLAEDTAPVGLVKVPAALSVTFTVSVQLPPTGTEPPLRLIALVP